MVDIRPQAGPQENFLASSADIAIYGGAAGGGKTWALLMEPLRHTRNKDFGAVFFRRETPQITAEGGLWDEAEKIYPLKKAKPRLSPSLSWEFPSAAKITMTHLQHEKTVLNWQGSQIPLILFDELTHFTRKQFIYMLSRNRSTCGIRPYIRATCNPDPDSFLVDWTGRENGGAGQGLIDWWIGDDGYPIQERAGVIRWFTCIKDTFHFGDTREELIERFGPKTRALSLTFIPSNIYDNKILMEADPDYLAKLYAQSEEQQQRLIHGNWRFKSEGGRIKRDQIIHLKPGMPVPDMVRIVVAVDPSGSSTVNSSEVGIAVCGKGVDGKGYVIEDYSGLVTPEQWANRAVNAYNHYQADKIVGERNYGGDMVRATIRGADRTVNYGDVTASRGKIIRLEPIAAYYERREIIHCKVFSKLENQLCSYNPETMDRSPDRMDAVVWAFTELFISPSMGGMKKVKLG
ncbi:hypothetical protein ABIB06_006559 [Bradyrhizobium sp. LB8.2]|uniref:terminase large subunit domain-containing protein n=1 Tax=unclassified Bradyrhizobium TaxID=2631580 RepID=UPI003392F4DA